MFRLFTYNHPLVYLLLLVLAFVFRIPSFQDGFITQDESVLLNAAVRLSENSVLYTGIITDDPPLLVWFWNLFYLCFGEFTLPAIRIFTCIYLFFAAFIFNQLVNDLKLIRERSLFPGVLFLLCVSFPWYAQETNGALLILLPLLTSVYLLIRTFDEGAKPLRLLFFVGILTSVSVLLNYQAMIFYISMPLIYFILRPAKIAEFFTLIIGFIIPVFFTGLIMYFQHALYAWWDTSILYQLDEFVNKSLVFYQPVPKGHKLEILFSLACLILPVAFGFIAFRMGTIRLNIQQRKIESVMAIWLGLSVFLLIINGLFKHNNPIIVMVFPLCFYVYRFFLQKIRPLFANSILLLIGIYPAWSGTQYYALNQEETELPYPVFPDEEWKNTLRTIFIPDPHTTALYKFMEKDAGEKNKTIWICGYPHLYQTQTKSFKNGSRYIDFPLFANKISFLKKNTYRSLISSEIDHAEIYCAFREEFPDYILDEINVFGEIKNQIPILLADYMLIYDGPVKIYARK